MKMRFTLPVLLRHWSLRRGRDKVTYAEERSLLFLLLLLSHYHFFFRLLYVVWLSPFREITGELGNRERWDAPTFIISFKFNLKFLFDRLRSPAIG